MAREVPVDEYMEKQLSAGRKVISNDAQSRALFAQLKSECPDVEEDSIVRSFATPGFGTKNVEAAVVATVHQKQFNAQNPRHPSKMSSSTCCPRKKCMKFAMTRNTVPNLRIC
jgi:hypothetical protein